MEWIFDSFDRPENFFEINSCYYWLFIRRRKLQQKKQPIRNQRGYFWFHINALIGQLLVNGRFTHVISEVNRMALSMLNIHTTWTFVNKL